MLDNGNTHLVGEKAIREFSLAPLKDFPDRKVRHWTSTFNVTPAPEGATLSAFYLTIGDQKGRPGMVIGGTGRYKSLVVTTKNAWRIKHHVVYGEGGVTARPEVRQEPRARAWGKPRVVAFYFMYFVSPPPAV